MNRESLVYNIALGAMIKEALTVMTPEAEHHLLDPQMTELAYHRGEPPTTGGKALRGGLKGGLLGLLAAGASGGDLASGAATGALAGGLGGAAGHAMRPEPLSFYFSIPKDRFDHPDVPDTTVAAVPHAQKLEDIKSGRADDEMFENMATALMLAPSLKEHKQGLMANDPRMKGLK